MIPLRPALTISLFILLPSALVYLEAGYESPRNIAALMAGVSAYSLIALNLMLAARLPILEGLAGGLDRIYALHRYSGIAVLALVLFHTQVKFIQLEGMVPPGALAETAVEVAKPAFIALVVLILLSAIKRLPKLRAEMPWMWWRITHWGMIPIFLILTFHQLFVKAPFDSNSAVRFWVYAMALSGLGAILWIVLMPWLRKRGYEVVAVEPLEAGTKVLARPLRRPITAKPGQFAFFSAARAGLREPHPFTLATLGPDGTIGFCIQPAGDFTRRLRQTLAPGDRLQIEGGYGRFDYQRGGKFQIWLAGGIGITPFLAMADAFDRAPDDRQITLIHAVRHAGLAVAQDRLREIAAAHPGFSYHLHDSSSMARLDTQTVEAYAKFALSEADLWYCGPKGLRLALERQWRERGTSPRVVHFEQFEFR